MASLIALGVATQSLTVSAEGVPQVVQHQDIGRIGGGERHRRLLQRHRAHGVLAQVLRREVLHHRQHGGNLLAPEERQLPLKRQRGQDVVAGGRAHRDQGLADPLSGRQLAGQRGLELLRRDRPGLDEDLSEPHGGLGAPCAASQASGGPSVRGRLQAHDRMGLSANCGKPISDLRCDARSAGERSARNFATARVAARRDREHS